MRSCVVVDVVFSCLVWSVLCFVGCWILVDWHMDLGGLVFWCVFVMGVRFLS